jgi:hypothetical protein
VLGCASRATAAEVLTCPATVEVEQHHAGAAAEGWEPSREPVRHPLMGVTFFDGPPSERASLAPDADEAKGKEHVLRFELGAPGPRGHWVSCVYDRTDVVLSRQLEPRVRACSVTVDPTVTVGGRPSVLRIACR